MATRRTKQNTNNTSSQGANKRLVRRQPNFEDDNYSAYEEPSIIKNDVIGVAFAVVALSMLISLLSDSSAPFTYYMGLGLRYSFGAGAPVIAIATLLYSFTYFMPPLKQLSGRLAWGLSLIVLTILASMSMLIEGADANLSLLFASQFLTKAGGYVGSGIAWLLLSYVGMAVGFVILIGLMLTGFIICGFSISGVVHKIADRAREKKAALDMQKAVEGGFLDEDEIDSDTPFEDIENAKTTFIGARKTSVSKRDEAPAIFDVEEDEEETPWEEPKTTLLPGRKRKVKEEKAEQLSIDTIHPEFSNEAVEETTKLSDRLASKFKRQNDVPDASEEIADIEVESSTQKIDKVAAGAGVVTGATAVANARKEKPLDTSNVRPIPTQEPAAIEGDIAPKVGKTPENIDRPGDGLETFQLPPFEILKSNPDAGSAAMSKQELQETGNKLQATLAEFGLKSKVVGFASGPLVTTFKIEMGEGERVNKITNLQDDIQLSLASESVRIFAPIPGTSLVGIEIPNKTRQSVFLGDVLPYAKGGPLEFAVGRDSEGRPVVANLCKMPHLLIAGTTGSGKSVMINSIIMSMLMRTTPEQVRLIMVDPKRVEFSGYNGLPHLYVPVVTEPRQASSALQWAVTEMERRLKVFERTGCRNIVKFNKSCVSGKIAESDHPRDPMPYLVIIIDELSDLMMVAGKEVEASIVRIAQLGRAAGIHLIVATQRPSADVVTGLIKSNIDSRIALKVSSSIDSRVILDSTGAERLLGYGDMLFRYSGSQTRRILAPYTSDEEIEEAVDFIRSQGEPDYHDEILSAVAPATPGASGATGDLDPLFWEAAQVVVDTQMGSTSGLQRKLSVGYARAGRIMDLLEAKGVVGPQQGSKPREVLMDSQLLEEFRVAEEKYQEVE